MALPRRSRYVPRSPAMSPCAVAVPIVAVDGFVTEGPGEQCTNPQQPDVAYNQTLIGGRGGQALDRGVGFDHVTVAPRLSSVFTRTPVAGTPHISRCPSPNRWSVAARIAGTAPSRSPHRAVSRAKRRSTSGKSPGVAPRRNAVAGSAKQLLSPVTLRSRWAVHQRKAQRHLGIRQREVITGSFGNAKGILNLAHRAIVGPKHAVRYRLRSRRR